MATTITAALATLEVMQFGHDQETRVRVNVVLLSGVDGCLMDPSGSR